MRRRVNSHTSWVRREQGPGLKNLDPEVGPVRCRSRCSSASHAFESEAMQAEDVTSASMTSSHLPV